MDRRATPELLEGYAQWLTDHISRSTEDRQGAFREALAYFDGMTTRPKRRCPEDLFLVGWLRCERYEWTAWQVIDGHWVSECDFVIPGHGSPVLRVEVRPGNDPTIDIDAGEDGDLDYPIEKALRDFANARIEEAPDSPALEALSGEEVAQ